jgi:hypothetical protein
VKRWGKSPPLVWQQARHGKPRVVQGQIGGESRPGSPSDASESLQRFLRGRAICSGEQPSGRLLEPWREPRPRGMIVRARSVRSTESGLYGSPALLSITYRGFEHYSSPLFVNYGLRQKRASAPHPLPEIVIAKNTILGGVQKYQGTAARLRGRDHRQARFGKGV